ncbi:MAG: hypothetical protein GF320_17895 [Armatimonadia bacterium]|nr:hypothetical protein [Armatimonadia bacterium]
MHQRIMRSTLLAGLIALTLGLLLPACETTATFKLELAATSTTPEVGDSVTVTVTVTRAEVPQANANVSWSAQPSSAASFSESTSTTNANGVAQVSVQILQEGSISVTATAGGTSQSVTLTATAAVGPRITLALSEDPVTVGDTSVATVSVTRDGVAQAGETVSLALSDPTVAQLDATTLTTDANGLATATLTGLVLGNTQVTAVWSGLSASTIFTVSTSTLPERLFVLSGIVGEVRVTDNRPGSAARAPGFTDIRFPFGVQRGGSLILATDANFNDAFVIDMTDLSESPFRPATLNLASTSPREELVGAITRAGDRVIWLRRQGSDTQIVAADLDGSDEQVLLSVTTAAAPTAMALSPDDTMVAYTTVGGEVRVLDVAGGTPRVLDLAQSTAPTGLDWLGMDTLAVAVSQYRSTGAAALLRVPVSGASASLLFRGSNGLISAPSAVAVDAKLNVIFDELDPTGSQSEIYRLDAPDYDERVTVLGRDTTDVRPALSRF